MASEIKVDTISEKTSAGGVTIDGLLIKDGGISGDVSLIGTTPTFTIGDAGAEDATLLFDGNAQDFHIGLDDSADDLVIGVGSALGTTTAIAIDENANSTFSGTVTVGVDDTGKDVKFFGATASAYMLWDESADDLILAGAAGLTVAGAVSMTGAVSLDGGNVIINESSASVDFRVESNGDANCLIVDGSADKVGIGLAVPEGKLHVMTADASIGPNGQADDFIVENNDHCGISILSKNDSKGNIYFGDSGDDDIGSITYHHDGNSMRFTTNASEAVRILDDGEVLIGGTTSTSSKLMVTQAASSALARFHQTVSDTSATLFKIKCDNSTGGDYVSFNIDRAGNSALNITGAGNVTNTNNSYGAISDERIKKDITDAKSQWNDIKALKIKNYKLKTDDESPTQLGVIAQDLETEGMGGLVQNSRPEAYLVNSHSDFGTLEDGTADNGAILIKDEDGNITGYEDVFTEGQKVKSVKYSVLYMKAIKALQEAQTRIETLETKVTALENE